MAVEANVRKPVYKAVYLQGWYPTCNETIIVQRLTQVLANFNNVLPEAWTFLIFHTPQCNFIRNATLGIPAHRLQFKQLYQKFTLKSWSPTMNKMFKSVPFWAGMKADRILYFHPDSVFCKNSSHSITDFLEWDYIGAPWYGPWFEAQAHLPQSQRTANWSVWDMWGGNGGLSLRSPAAMVECIKKFRPSMAG